MKKSAQAKKPDAKSKRAASPKKAPAATAEEHGHDHGHDHGEGCGCGGSFELSIRPYKPEDYRELKAVWKAGDILIEDTDSAKALKENSEKRKNSFRIFVAEARDVDDATGKTIGEPRMAAGVIVTYDGRRAYVYHFAVHPDFRGVGLGSAMLEMCEKQAKLWGAKHLRLMSRNDASRESARRLYEKRGWTAVENLSQYAKEI